MKTFRSAAEYNMNHKNRGMAIIFNHENFDDFNDLPRRGSNKDLSRLKKTLESLNFEVESHTDLSANEIKEKIRKVSEMDHADSDCILISIMTHGEECGVLSAKDEKYNLNEITEYFSADNCPSLARKPKIFFIQACRGNKLDFGTKMTRTRSETDKTEASSAVYQLPNEIDFIIVHSSAEGYYSFRKETEGSCFIQCLCDELDQNGNDENLFVLLTRVCQNVAYDFESNSRQKEFHQIKQIPSITSTLTRILRFSPE